MDDSGEAGPDSAEREREGPPSGITQRLWPWGTRGSAQKSSKKVEVDSTQKGGAAAGAVPGSVKIGDTTIAETDSSSQAEGDTQRVPSPSNPTAHTPPSSEHTPRFRTGLPGFRTYDVSSYGRDTIGRRYMDGTAGPPYDPVTRRPDYQQNSGYKSLSRIVGQSSYYTNASSGTTTNICALAGIVAPRVLPAIQARVRGTAKDMKITGSIKIPDRDLKKNQASFSQAVQGVVVQWCGANGIVAFAGMAKSVIRKSDGTRVLSYAITPADRVDMLNTADELRLPSDNIDEIKTLERIEVNIDDFGHVDSDLTVQDYRGMQQYQSIYSTTSSVMPSGEYHGFSLSDPNMLALTILSIHFGVFLPVAVEPGLLIQLFTRVTQILSAQLTDVAEALGINSTVVWSRTHPLGCLVLLNEINNNASAISVTASDNLGNAVRALHQAVVHFDNSRLVDARRLIPWIDMVIGLADKVAGVAGRPVATPHYEAAGSALLSQIKHCVDDSSLFDTNGSIRIHSQLKVLTT